MTRGEWLGSMMPPAPTRMRGGRGRGGGGRGRSWGGYGWGREGVQASARRRRDHPHPALSRQREREHNGGVRNELKQIRLNAFDMNCVGHIQQGLWRHPRDKSVEYGSLGYWVELARLLERGLFDGLFL